MRYKRGALQKACATNYDNKKKNGYKANQKIVISEDSHGDVRKQGETFSE